MADGERWVTCQAHGKRAYWSRKAAKKAIRELRGPQGMREYPCTELEGGFHIGHIPERVKRGKVTIGQIYREVRRATS